MAGGSTEMTGPLRLRLFGGFHLEDAAGRPVALKLRKAEALFAYVAVSPGQAAARQELAALLWGESEQPRARQSLRQVLLALSKALAGCEPPVLQVTNQTVALSPAALSVDATDLDRLMGEGSPAALAAAATLYRDDFLAGLSLDSPDFEDWLDATRSRLRDLALKGLERLLQVQESADDVGPAVATVHQALRIDPYREDLHRRLMQLYARNGMRSSALAQFRACRDLLERELGIEPDRETVRLFETLLDQAAPEQGDTRPAAGRTENPGGPAQTGAEADILVAHHRALAQQFIEAGQRAQAFDFLLLAARVELRRGGFAAAEALSAEAERFAAKQKLGPSSTADIQLLRAALAERREDLEGLSRSLARAESSAGSGQASAIMSARSRLLARAGQLNKAFEQARLALEQSGPAAGADPWCPVERFLVDLHLVSGGAASLTDPLAREVAQLSNARLTGDQARTTALLALARALAGDGGQALADSRLALTLAEESGDKACLGACLYAAGWVSLVVGDAAASLAAFDQALRVADARGDLLRRYLVTACRGAARVSLGRRDAGLADLAGAEVMAKRLNTRFFLPFVKSWIAEAARGDELLQARAAAALAGACNQPWAQSIAYRAAARAQMRAARPDHAAAARDIEAAVAIQRGMGLTAELTRSRVVWSELLKARQEGETAEIAR